MYQLPDSPQEILEKLSEKRARPDVGAYAAPRDELEQAVCQLWSDVLLLDRVGRDDNILDLRGDSFHMAIIAARLGEAYGLEMQVGDFFEHPTVAATVAFLRARGGCKLTAAAGATEIGSPSK
jgi:arthrofactin-type cyclic lipopeptide synthetase A